eukprot:COSAG06_NODE_1208_length_10261_cov_5.380634_2_plen_36_part_00
MNYHIMLYIRRLVPLLILMLQEECSCVFTISSKLC